MDISEAKQQIIRIGEKLGSKNMSPGTSGNISIRFGENILITGSGTCLYELSEDDIVLMDYNGNLLNGNKKPSSEKIMHSEIYTKRDDINAIIHSHCPLITAFAVAGKVINKTILPDFALLFGEIPIVPYFCPSSIELATTVGEYFEKYSAVLLKNHGVVIGADSLQNAFYKLEFLRSYVETYFGAEVLGGAKKLTKKDILEVKQVYKK